jgi:hypothetical protein
MSCSWKQSRTGKRMHIVRDGDRVPLSATWSDCRVEPSMSEYADHSDAGSQAWISHSVISFDYRVVEVPREGCSIPLRCFDLWPYAPLKLGGGNFSQEGSEPGDLPSMQCWLDASADPLQCWWMSRGSLRSVACPFASRSRSCTRWALHSRTSSRSLWVVAMRHHRTLMTRTAPALFHLPSASSRQSLFRCRDLDAVLSGYDLPHATDSDVESMVVGAPAAVSPNDV